jgi:hypothetical protein
VVDTKMKYQLVYKIVKFANKKLNIRGNYVIGLSRRAKLGWAGWAGWIWSHGAMLTGDFIPSRWAKGEPDGKDANGSKFNGAAWAVMDPNGKLRDEARVSDVPKYHMCTCENAV